MVTWSATSDTRRVRIRRRAAALAVATLALGGLTAVGAPPAGAAPANADLSVTITHSPSAPFTGTPLTITLTATNAGPGTAQAVVAGYSLGYSLRYTPPPTASPSADPCRVGGDTSTALCTLGNMAPGSSMSVTITVTPFSSGVFVVPAAVSSETPDPDTADRSASDTIIVQQGPTQIESAVGAIYPMVLGRAASPAEVAYWSKVWNESNWQVQYKAPLGIISGAESRARRIREAYTRLLHRSAGAGDVAAWSARMARGTTIEDLEATLASSREFVAKAPAGGAVSAIFSALLGRRASSHEVASWNARLHRGTTLAQMAHALVRSTEGRNRVIEARFQTTFHRSPQNFDRFFWFSALNEGSTSDREWAKLLASGEYLSQFPPVYGPVYPID